MLRINVILAVLVALSGCVSADYERAVVVGNNKAEVFDSLRGWGAEWDFAQVYWDAESGTEIFFPIDTDLAIHNGGASVAGQILVFKNVTRPTLCPLSRRATGGWDWKCPGGATTGMGDHGYCYNGDGVLHSALNVTDVLGPEASAVDINPAMLAAIEIFYEVQEARIEHFLRRGASDLEARSYVLCEHNKQHIKTARHYGDVFDYWVDNSDVYEWGGPPASFEKRVRNDPDFLPYWEARYGGEKPPAGRIRDKSYTSYPSVRSNQKIIEPLVELLGLALEVWVAYEVAEFKSNQLQISDTDLRRIEDAAFRGAARGAKSRSAQEQAMKNVQKMYCNNNKGNKYSIARDC